ncbi:MAG: ATP-binding cassette domain-containing protein [Clostridia bacterium]|nr:ATP-binding cassette domain-containing protein [Clostridia bacterium]
MKINNLYKAFEEKIIFNDFSIEIPDGKITFIIGESGCGKTTLLRILAGLDSSFSGQIDSSSSRISCVFQEPRLFPAISVLQNIELVEKGNSLPTNEILKLVELDTEENQYPDSLSGGMKMRLSLARALYYNGDMFLMDEPFSALDENMKARIIPKVLSLLKGKTVIIVSHDMEDVNSYADNIINLSKENPPD